MSKSCNRSCPFCNPKNRRGIRNYLIVIWGLVFVSTLFYYYLGNAPGHSLWYVFNASLFFINIPFFSFAVLSLVAERGLFNGIRYSVKQVKYSLFKNKQNQAFDEYNVNSAEELREVLKEKYLYQSPRSTSTFPLLLVSGITFLFMIIFSFF